MNLNIILICLFVIFSGFGLNASNAIDTDLEDYRWKNRLVLIFATGPDSDSYLQQIEKMNSDKGGLQERDVLVFSLFQQGTSYLNDKAISQESAERIIARYNSGQKEFRFILIGKDGGVKLDKEMIVSTGDLFGNIDSMPMRRQEMRRSMQRSDNESGPNHF